MNNGVANAIKREFCAKSIFSRPKLWMYIFIIVFNAYFVLEWMKKDTEEPTRKRQLKWAAIMSVTPIAILVFVFYMWHVLLCQHLFK